MSRTKFQRAFTQAVEIILRRYSAGETSVFNDGTDTWTYVPLRNYPNCIFMVTLANPNLSTKKQYGAILIVDTDDDSSLIDPSIVGSRRSNDSFGDHLIKVFTDTLNSKQQVCVSIPNDYFFVNSEPMREMVELLSLVLNLTVDVSVKNFGNRSAR